MPEDNRLGEPDLRGIWSIPIPPQELKDKGDIISATQNRNQN